MPDFARAGSSLWDGLARIEARITRLIGAMEVAVQVRQERRMLLGLDDRMLKDLGLNGGIAHAEASRRCWDVPTDRLRRDAATDGHGSTRRVACGVSP
jgi:uncharacterized protein YjiS (DUF1127 family)